LPAVERFIMNIKEVIKKDGTKVYRSNVYLGVDSITGKKARTSVTARTKKELKQKAKQAITAFINNGYTTKTKVTIKTYKELAYLWWDNYKDTVKANTKHSTEGRIRVHLLPAFGDYKLEKLTTPIIQQQVNKWANDYNKGKKGSYQHYDQLHALNKRILQYAVIMQLIPFNPAREVIVPRKKQTEKEKIKFLDKQELKQFYDYLDTLDLSNYQNLFDSVLYKTLLATGCRVSEALALEWSDIDLENGVVRINKTLDRYRDVNAPKSKAGYRDISIDKATILMLKHYKNRQQVQSWQLGRSETVVFSIFIDDYAHLSTLRQRLIKHFENAGVPYIGFHGLRHTHATIMLNAGIQPKDLQYRLGHSNISMTLNTYVHATKEGAKNSASFFESAINGLG
jgi:integrase